MNARNQLALFADPGKFVTASVVFALLLWRIRRFRMNLSARDRVLIFAIVPPPSFSGLRLQGDVRSVAGAG
jgi:hypothetical protein